MDASESEGGSKATTPPSDLSASALEQQYRDDSHLNARIGLHERFSTSEVPWQRWVFDQLRLPEYAHVLELGSGTAALWHENLDRIPTGWQITISDASPGMLDAARAALGPHASRFFFRQIDAQSIPYVDGVFDDVIANHMLYHVPDRPRALAEIRRVVKPGGAFYAATNGEGHMRELGTLLGEVDSHLEALWRERIRVAAGAFTLENGAEQLRAVFSPVRVRQRESILRVTEAQPILDYLASMSIGADILSRADVLPALRERIERTIEAEGAFTIHTESGIFQALRPMHVAGKWTVRIE